MHNYTYKLDLRIHHPSIDPQLITTALDLQPRRAFCVGKPRMTPNGMPLDGVYPETYWSGDVVDGGWSESTDELVEDALDRLLRFLEQHEAFLQDIGREGRVGIWISSQSRYMYAFELPPALLARVAALGASLVHDVYAGF